MVKKTFNVSVLLCWAFNCFHPQVHDVLATNRQLSIRKPTTFYSQTDKFNDIVMFKDPVFCGSRAQSSNVLYSKAGWSSLTQIIWRSSKPFKARLCRVLNRGKNKHWNLLTDKQTLTENAKIASEWMDCRIAQSLWPFVFEKESKAKQWLLWSLHVA